jgi:small-conductance mechanosensitive channel
MNSAWWGKVWRWFERQLHAGWLESGLRIVLILVLAWVLMWFVRRNIERLRVRPQYGVLLTRVLSVVVSILALVLCLREFGVKLDVLLGTAGILTVAIGFASQTSASNVVSGLFLFVDQPFKIGDVIDVGGQVGEVLSIDLLSVKLRTFDNRLLRIPNESLLKSNIVNLTHFPIRRIDLPVGVAYKEDLTKVRELLLKIAEQNPLCLEEPKPTVLFLGFGDSSINLRFSAWVTQANFVEVTNSLPEQVKRCFDDNGVEIPFPQRVVTLATAAAPPLEVAPEEPVGVPIEAAKTAEIKQVGQGS